MKTTEVFSIDGQQAVRLPQEFQFPNGTVAIRKHGESVILEPVKPDTWPNRFFEEVRIEDPKFSRPQQPDLPEVTAFDGSAPEA